MRTYVFIHNYLYIFINKHYLYIFIHNCHSVFKHFIAKSSINLIEARWTWSSIKSWSSLAWVEYSMKIFDLAWSSTRSILIEYQILIESSLSRVLDEDFSSSRARAWQNLIESSLSRVLDQVFGSITRVKSLWSSTRNITSLKNGK